MPKLMTILLALSFLTCAQAIADDKPSGDAPKLEKKGKKNSKPKQEKQKQHK
jgi:hypothetical protein